MNRPLYSARFESAQSAFEAAPEPFEYPADFEGHCYWPHCDATPDEQPTSRTPTSRARDERFAIFGAASRAAAARR